MRAKRWLRKASEMRVWNVSEEQGSAVDIIVGRTTLQPGQSIDIDASMWIRLRKLPQLRNSPPNPPPPRATREPPATLLKLTYSALNNMRKAALVDFLKEAGMGVSASMTKKELLAAGRNLL